MDPPMRHRQTSTQTLLRLRRLGGGLRSWLDARGTRASALNLTAPPSCGGSAEPSCCVRLPLMGRTTACTSSMSPREDAAGEREPSRQGTDGGFELRGKRRAESEEKAPKMAPAACRGGRYAAPGARNARASAITPSAIAAASPAFALRKVGLFLLFVGAGSGFESSMYNPLNLVCLEGFEPPARNPANAREHSRTRNGACRPYGGVAPYVHGVSFHRWWS